MIFFLKLLTVRNWLSMADLNKSEPPTYQSVFPQGRDFIFDELPRELFTEQALQALRLLDTSDKILAYYETIKDKENDIMRSVESLAGIPELDDKLTHYMDNAHLSPRSMVVICSYLRDELLYDNHSFHRPFAGNNIASKTFNVFVINTDPLNISSKYFDGSRKYFELDVNHEIIGIDLVDVTKLPLVDLTVFQGCIILCNLANDYSRKQAIDLMSTYNTIPSVCQGFNTFVTIYKNSNKICGTMQLPNCTRLFTKLLGQLLNTEISNLSIKNDRYSLTEILKQVCNMQAVTGWGLNIQNLEQFIRQIENKDCDKNRMPCNIFQRIKKAIGSNKTKVFRVAK